MVLQQQPAKSAVYGTVAGPASSKIVVTVTSSGGAAYTADAVVTAAAGAASGNSTWKAFLKPTAAGGNYTISAKCGTGCTGAAQISDVTFGDVWYCSGQSNMALPVLHTFSRNKSRDAIQSGNGADIRIHGLKGNMNQDQIWSTAAAACEDDVCTDLFQFSSTCWCFAGLRIGLAPSSWGWPVSG